ncbi:putative pyruvate kinase [Helianthus annuus]|nr:putative pyruvate kinase [Helianthus annuus]
MYDRMANQKRAGFLLFVRNLTRHYVARFDFTWGDADFHQETLENLQTAIKKTKKLCSVMLDTTGPELLVVNKGRKCLDPLHLLYGLKLKKKLYRLLTTQG